MPFNGRPGDRLWSVPNRNRPDTAFGSGGHILQDWSKRALAHDPNLRHGLKLVTWNLARLHDLFGRDEQGRPALRPDDDRLNPANGSSDEATVGGRLTAISDALSDMEPDILVVLGGPASQAELELLLDRVARGRWWCHVQRSLSQVRPGGELTPLPHGIGMAVRVDTGRFEPEAAAAFDAESPATGPLHDATEPFFLDGGPQVGVEWIPFEQRPLYVELRPRVGARFRLLAIHLRDSVSDAVPDWTRWRELIEARRRRLHALCRRLRLHFVDHFLEDPSTRDVPLVVCGCVDDGPGARIGPPLWRRNGVEVLMGSVWRPELTLGNALYDTLEERARAEMQVDGLWTAVLPDPLTPDRRHRAWTDHVLYTRNAPAGWVAGAQVLRRTAGGTNFSDISDHMPVTVRIDTTTVLATRG